MVKLVPKVYPLLVECIERGVQLGLNRAYKHTDEPDREMMMEAISQAVFTELFEVFELERGVDDD